MRFWGSSSNFRFSLRTNLAGVVSADRLAHSMAAGAVTDPFESFITARVLRGTLRFRHGGEDRVLRQGDFARYPTVDDLICSWEDVDLELVRLPLATIDAVAAQVSENASGVRFHSMQAVSIAAGLRWVAMSRFLHELIGTTASPAELPIVQQQLADLAAATALNVFPNSIMTRAYSSGVGFVGPPSTRRAAEFIEAHAAEPLTIADIAEAVGVSPRALQSAFRRHHDTTPMAFLRQVRLEAAHHELQAADPTAGATVKAIAAKWGFAKPDRFSALYRDMFGVPPSRTLRS